MLASTDQFLRQIGILNITDIRVSVTHATTADTDIFNGIEVLQHRLFY